MKMAELVKESGCSKPLIQYYINIGLLHKPMKTGKTVAFYDENHLNKLNRIRHLRKKKGLSIAEIKSMLDQEGGATAETEQILLDKKTQIMEKATELFSANGFTKTNIADIAEAAGLKTTSFYFHFKNKKELFIHCCEYIGRLIVQEMSEEVFKTEKDYVARQWIRTATYLNSFRYYSGILNSLKTFLRSDDPKMMEFAKNAYRTFLEPIITDHRRAIEKGIMFETDEILVAYGIYGFAEGMGYALMLNPSYSLEDVVDLAVEIINRGMLARSASRRRGDKSHSILFDVTDSQGTRRRIWDITFGNDEYLHGNSKKGKHRIRNTDISTIEARDDHSKTSLLITTESGRKLTLRVDGNLPLAGKSLDGDYCLSIKCLSTMTNVRF